MDKGWDKHVHGVAIKGVSQCDIVEKIAPNPNCYMVITREGTHVDFNRLIVCLDRKINCSIKKNLIVYSCV